MVEASPDPVRPSSPTSDEADPSRTDHLAAHEKIPSDTPAVGEPHSLARSRVVSIARWSGVAVSIMSVAFAIMTYLGVWNYLRGDILVSDVAVRFDKSYSEGASMPVKRGDKEWKPLIRIITKYTHTQIPHDREPLVFARFRAVLSDKTEVGGKVFAEWTAPTTPVALLYKEWPGQELEPADYRIVGTIQDLHEWIRNDEADFDFLTRTIIFGLLSACVGTFLALHA